MDRSPQLPAAPATPAAPLPAGARRGLAFALLLGLLGPGWIAWTSPPHSNYDERFSRKNVEWVLRSGRLLPSSYYWYAPPAYLPQTWALGLSSRVARATGWSALETWKADPEFRFTSWGIRLSRLPGVLYGVVALGALAALALRLAGPWEAALAPLLFVSSPWFHAGIYGFKPDPLLLALSLLCLAQLLRYLDEGRPGEFWIAALLFGAATAAKLNGALLAVPVALAALREPTWAKRIGRAVLGGLAGIAVYLLLVPWPWPREALRYLEKLDAQYDRRAAAEGPLDMLGILLAKLGAPHFFGWWIALAAAAGLALVLSRGSRRRRSGLASAGGWGLVLALGLTHLGFLAATTRYPKENHLLPILPLVALLAALPLAAPLRWLDRRSRPRLASALLAAAAAFATVRTVSFAATESAPIARSSLVNALQSRLDGRSGRVVAWLTDERRPLEIRRARQGLPPAAARVELAALAQTDRLAAFDCIAGEGTVPARLAAAATQRFQPRALRTLPWPARLLPGRREALWWGCAPWSHAARIELRLEPAASGLRRATLPLDLPAHAAVSLEVSSRRPDTVTAARIDGRPYPLLEIYRLERLRGVLLVTPRALAPVHEIALELGGATRQDPRIALLLWNPPPAEAGAPGGEAGPG